MPALPMFSMLLPVYGGDRPEYLRESFRSAVHDQTLRPDEVVIVRDGPVPDELAACIADLSATSPVKTTVLELPENRGLGPALDAGLRACTHDIVARMDADDIAVPHRFAVQIPELVDADIVGGGLLEFDSATGAIVGRRVPPIGRDRIVRFARIHSPFNHPTVVYRRTAIAAAGGYGDLPLMEDYWLFARMLAGGARPVNIADPLVYYRVGPDAYKRRGGGTLLRSEMALQRRFHREGFTTTSEYVRNVSVRAAYRLIPWWARRGVYRMSTAMFGGRAPWRAAPPLPSAAARRLEQQPEDAAR